MTKDQRGASYGGVRERLRVVRSRERGPVPGFCHRQA